MSVLLTVVGVQANGASVSVQIVNPDAQTAVRVFLDRKLIYEGVPERSRLGNQSTVPALAGVFEFDGGAHHALVAEAPASGAKARLEWPTASVRSPWIVIRYYPGRSADGEPPFFTFALQESAAALK